MDTIVPQTIDELETAVKQRLEQLDPAVQIDEMYTIQRMYQTMPESDDDDQARIAVFGAWLKGHER